MIFEYFEEEKLTPKWGPMLGFPKKVSHWEKD